MCYRLKIFWTQIHFDLLINSVLPSFVNVKNLLNFFRVPRRSSMGRRSARHEAKTGVHNALADLLSEWEGNMWPIRPSRRTSALITMPRSFIVVTDGWFNLCLWWLMGVLFVSNFVAFSSFSNHSSDRLISAESSGVQVPYPAVWRLLRLCCNLVHDIFAHLVVCDSRSRCSGLGSSGSSNWPHDWQ